jgi:hypothetical protein
VLTFPLCRNGSYSVVATNPTVAGETCLANPLRRSDFQAARHNIYMSWNLVNLWKCQKMSFVICTSISVKVDYIKKHKLGGMLHALSNKNTWFSDFRGIYYLCIRGRMILILDINVSLSCDILLGFPCVFPIIILYSCIVCFMRGTCRVCHLTHISWFHGYGSNNWWVEIIICSSF